MTPVDNSSLPGTGQKTPVLPDNSPLMSGLVEPRPKPGGGKFEAGPLKDGPATPVASESAGSIGMRLFLVASVLLVLATIGLVFWGINQASDTTPAPETGGADQTAAMETGPGDQAMVAETVSKSPESGSVVRNFSGPEKVAAATKPPPSGPQVNAAIPRTSPEPLAGISNPPVSPVPPSAKPTVKITPEQQNSSPDKSDKKATVAGPKGGYAIQLASFRNQQLAVSEAARLQKRIGKYLKGRKITVVEGTAAGKGTVWRLRAVGFVRADARSVCNRIKRIKTNCLALKLEN